MKFKLKKIKNGGVPVNLTLHVAGWDGVHAQIRKSCREASRYDMVCFFIWPSKDALECTQHDRFDHGVQIQDSLAELDINPDEYCIQVRGKRVRATHELRDGDYVDAIYMGGKK